MPFKRAGWLQPRDVSAERGAVTVSMPFKRAGWLQPHNLDARPSFSARFNAL